MAQNNDSKEQIEMIINNDGKSNNDQATEPLIGRELIPSKYVWRSCCLILDSRAVLFFSQLVISIAIIIFCIRQLMQFNDGDSQRNYGMLLTFMIGLWFPAPRIGQ